MSARNWTTCPKCKVNAETELAGMRIKLAESYGKVPADEYERMRGAIPDKPRLKENTMREDYEIGTDEDGQFSVSYSCSCAVCGFSYDFKHREDATG